jgi:hypothetical protein
LVFDRDDQFTSTQPEFPLSDEHGGKSEEPIAGFYQKSLAIIPPVLSEKPKARHATDFSVKHHASVVQSLPRDPPTHVASMLPPPVKYPSLAADPASTAEADLLLNLHSTYSNTASASQPVPKPHDVYCEPIPPIHHSTPVPSFDLNQNTQDLTQYHPDSNLMASAPTPYSDMMIESQDIDMSCGPLGGFTFPNGEMIALSWSSL